MVLVSIIIGLGITHLLFGVSGIVDRLSQRRVRLELCIAHAAWLGFCFVWMILVGAMIAVRDGTHFDVDVLPHSTDPRVEFGFRLFVNVAILVMALSFLWWGWDFYILGSRQKSEIFGLPMWMIYVAWPLAGATWTLFLIERIHDDIRGHGQLEGDSHGAG